VPFCTRALPLLTRWACPISISLSITATSVASRKPRPPSFLSRTTDMKLSLRLTAPNNLTIGWGTRARYLTVLSSSSLGGEGWFTAHLLANVRSGELLRFLSPSNVTYFHAMSEASVRHQQHNDRTNIYVHLHRHRGVPPGGVSLVPLPWTRRSDRLL